MNIFDVTAVFSRNTFSHSLLTQFEQEFLIDIKLMHAFTHENEDLTSGWQVCD